MSGVLENKFLLLLINILMPYVLAVLLSDIAGINISAFMKSIFSILESIELVGYPIQTKSMILLFAFIFSPMNLMLLLSKKASALDIAEKDISSFKLIFSSLMVWIGAGALIYLYLGGVDISKQIADGYVQPGMRLFFSSITTDLKFSFFTSFTVFVICFAFIGSGLSIKALFIRLQK